MKSLPVWQPACKACSLHTLARSVCIATQPLNQTTSSTALLLLGEKPMTHEDEHGTVFTGPQGSQYLRGVYLRWLESAIKRPVSIYGQNATRCFNPGADNTPDSAIKACRTHLLADIDELGKTHSEIIVLAMGGPACKSVWGRTLGASLRKQGHEHVIGETRVRVFATMNFGVMAPGRDPAAIRPISDHLAMLADYINHGRIPMTVEMPVVYPPLDRVPQAAGDILSLDFETYGSVEGRPKQTCYHPVKMKHLDGVDPEHIIVSAACSWREGAEIKSAAWSIPQQTWEFIEFMRSARRRGMRLLGHNLCFDLMCARAHPYIRVQFKDDHWFLLDTQVANYLDNESRPERTLKELARLFRVHDYDHEKSLADGWRYSSNDDPELLSYNVADTVVTLVLWERIRDAALRRYTRRTLWGQLTGKFSPACLSWFNDVLRNALSMDEAGIAHDRRQLRDLHRDTLRSIRTHYNEGLRLGLKFAGPKSEKPLRVFIARAIQEAGLLGDPRIKKTDGGQISIDAENRQIIEYSLPLDSPTLPLMQAYSAFKSLKTLRDSYTSQRSRDLIGNMAYPTWYATPAERLEGGGAGTKQGRMTASDPGVQKDHPKIRKCRTTRFNPGVLTHSDASQIELLVAALLSHDPVMFAEFQRGVDNHLSTGVLILRELVGLMQQRNVSSLYGTDRDWAEEVLDAVAGRELLKPLALSIRERYPLMDTMWRQGGKQTNFGIIFLGGADALQRTFRKKMKAKFDIEFCRRIKDAATRKYKGLIAWHGQVLDFVSEVGYLEFPGTGESRFFTKSKIANMESYRSEIANCMIQNVASRIVMSAQTTCRQAFSRSGMQSVLCENVYDALDVDSPACEERRAAEIVQVAMTCPPYYRDLCTLLGRQLPLKMETKVIARSGDPSCGKT